MHSKTLLPRKWLDITCSWEVENESFSFLYFCMQPLLFFIKLPLSQPRSFTILFSPHPAEEVREWLGGHLAASEGQPTTEAVGVCA